MMQEVRAAADLYETWQGTLYICAGCEDYEDCPSCSVLLEYEVAMVLLVATLATVAGFETQSVDLLVRAAQSLVKMNWSLRYEDHEQ